MLWRNPCTPRPVFPERSTRATSTAAAAVAGEEVAAVGAEERAEAAAPPLALMDNDRFSPEARRHASTTGRGDLRPDQVWVAAREFDT